MIFWSDIYIVRFGSQQEKRCSSQAQSKTSAMLLRRTARFVPHPACHRFCIFAPVRHPGLPVCASTWLPSFLRFPAAITAPAPQLFGSPAARVKSPGFYILAFIIILTQVPSGWMFIPFTLPSRFPSHSRAVRVPCVETFVLIILSFPFAHLWLISFIPQSSIPANEKPTHPPF